MIRVNRHKAEQILHHSSDSSLFFIYKTEISLSFISYTTKRSVIDIECHFNDSAVATNWNRQFNFANNLCTLLELTNVCILNDFI